MSYYTDLINKAKGIGLFNINSWAAKKWFQAQAAKVRGASPETIMRSDPTALRPASGINAQMIGQMLMYFYDAKTKKQLPYYDRFPLIFVLGPSKKVKGAYLGLNMHYLPPYHRAKLFDALKKGTNLVDPNARERFNYGTLKSASQYAAYKPCLKMYLYGYVKSQFFVVPNEQWDTVLFLPLARFVSGGKSKSGVVDGYISIQKVYSDSLKKARL